MPVEEGELGPDGFTELLGIEHLEPGDADARARLEISDRIRQPQGLVHGGVYPLLAETVASKATAEAVHERGELAMGQSNNATFLRPVRGGYVTAIGHVIHRGRTAWVWDVECRDDEGQLAAAVRLVIAVRPRRGERVSRESGS